MYCTDISDPVWLIFSGDAPNLLYYSHIPTSIIALALAFWVFKQKKSILAKAFLSVALFFSTWAFINLIVWTNNSIDLVMFAWSFFPMVYVFLCVSLAYFLYLYTNSEDISIKRKLLYLAPLLPVLVLTSLSYNIDNISMADCGPIENVFFTQYTYIIGISYVALSLVYAARSYIKSEDRSRKIQIALSSLGVTLLTFSFFSSGVFASYLYDIGLEIGDYDLQVYSYNMEQYGLFGMAVFVALLAILIVRYKAFDIKLLATQALIWTLIVLVGSQFLFIRNPINYILNGITFVGAIISGIMIVRSVKRVDAQREQLALANQEQETLVHFITHQIKGFFTKSRNIFDTLTDMENVPEGALRLVSEGLRSDKEGVELVENILNAANMKNGKMKFENKEIDLDSIVKKIISDTSEAVATKQIKLNYYCSTSPVKFMGDEFRMRDVFKNLIQNAISYTFEGGITIYLNQKADHIEFIVQDTGIGLTDDDKRRLFTSGGRGVESVKYNVSSTGYGLFIVKKVIDNYNGRIWAESEGRNKGSKFTLILPLV